MSTESGKRAEEAAAKYLELKGYKILDMNWRRPKCEIDIVASKAEKTGLFSREKTVYFIEVKYRRNTEHGSGLDYITAQKLRQMKFAADMWVADENWQGSYELGAVEVAGKDYQVQNFIPEIDK